MMRWRRGKAANASGKVDSWVGAAGGGGNEAVHQVAGANVEGERDVPSVNRERSLQSRVNNLLALVVVMVIGGGFLFWWYSNVQKEAEAQARLKQERQAKAGGEMKLPPLGEIETPRAVATDLKETPDEGPTLIGDVLGPAPPMGTTAATPAQTTATPGGPAQLTPAQLELQRKLSPSVLFRQGSGMSASAPTPMQVPPAVTVGAQSAGAPGGSGAPNGIGGYLTPTATPATAAQVLASRRFILPKGSFLDCTLETALDSQLPGLVTCVTAVDIFGADGQVVLAERGSKLVGESKGDVRQGMNRVFVLWNELRTPSGVVVHLASPATDALGRAGLPGYAETHFWDRFGAAILISVVDGAIRALVQSHSRGDSVIVNPQASRDIMTEILRNTISIPPTVVKNQGDRIQVMVARDVDFRPVYELRTAGAN